MSTMYMMIGIPGSGKSTEAKRLGKSLGIPVISSDEIRKDLTGSEEDFSMDKEIWTSVIPRRLRSALKEGDVVFDATNLRVRGRNTIRRSIGTEHSCCAVYMDTPLEVCIKRQEARERKVPRERIEEMHSALVPPTVSEGFDYVLVVEYERAHVCYEPEDPEKI